MNILMITNWLVLYSVDIWPKSLFQQNRSRDVLFVRH